MISKTARIFRFAVADGATETSFSGIWAKQLVRAYCKGLLDGPEFPEHVRSLREQWKKVVSRKPLPWYGEEKLRSGAFAAIAGLILEQTDLTGQGTWTAMAVGDSCVFHLRGTKVLECFPLQKSEDFNNSPRLLASKTIVGEAELLELPAVSGVWLAGDTFYLMTDAIACWFLKQAETSKTPPARELGDLTDGNANPFQAWLRALRETGHLRNDDITILRVEIENN